MTKILIPRSDSISAKIIEPTDFTYLHSSDLIQNYKISGFTISAGSGLACNVAAGSGRLNGLYISSDATETKSSLTASQTNSIYIKLDLDSGSQPEGWSLFSNTSGGAVTNAVLLGTAVTNGSAVTGVTNVITTKPHNFTTTNTELIPFNVLEDQSLQNIGSGTAGDILYSDGTNWTKIAKGDDGQYLTLSSGIPGWTTLPNPDHIGTMTQQRAELGSDSNSLTGTTTSGGRDVFSITLPDRAGGKFMATAHIRMAGGDRVMLRFIDGATVKNHIGAGQISGNSNVISLSLTGSLSGQVLKVNAAHLSGDDSRTIHGNSTQGYSHMEVIEISPA